MTKRDTRTKLIAAGMELFATQGYNATGLDAVLKRAEVPKGSFYHYFGSKEEFGLAVIEEFACRFLSRLDAFLADPATAPLDRLRIFLQRGLERLAEHQCTVGCLIGDLGQDARLRDRMGPAGKARVKQEFTIDRMVDRVMEVYKMGHPIRDLIPKSR